MDKQVRSWIVALEAAVASLKAIKDLGEDLPSEVVGSLLAFNELDEELPAEEIKAALKEDSETSSHTRCLLIALDDFLSNGDATEAGEKRLDLIDGLRIAERDADGVIIVDDEDAESPYDQIEPIEICGVTKDDDVGPSPVGWDSN